LLVQKYKNTFSTKLLLIGFSCTVLFDLYHPVFGKIFDVLAYLFIIFAILFNKNLYQQKLFLYKKNIIWILPMLIVGFLSIIISPLTAFAIIFGLLILLIVTFYFEEQIYFNAIKFLTISQKILLLTQIIQLLIWILTGVSIDYGEFLGFNTSRNFDGIFFRASGILAEANGMTVTQSLLFITLLKYRKNNIDLVIFLISIFITFSLQGALIGIITLFFFFFSNSSKEKLYLKIFVFISLLILFISSAYEYISKAYEVFLFRIDQFDDDQSLYYRILKPITLPITSLLRPHFYDIVEAAEYGPSNAYFTGLYFFGIFFLIFLWNTIKKFLNNGLLSVLILLITLLSYQVYTTALFWAMISFAEVKDRHENRLKYKV
jgi:hypothetical protein